MSYLARSSLLRLRSQLGRFHRGAAYQQPLSYFSGNKSHSDDDVHMLQRQSDDSRRGPLTLLEFRSPKMLPSEFRNAELLQHGRNREFQVPSKHEKMIEPKATQEALPPSSLYLQVGSAVARLVIKPNNSPPHNLEFAFRISGFSPAEPGLIARNDEIFLFGYSARYRGEDYYLDEYDGQQAYELWCYYCKNNLYSNELIWTVFAPTPAAKLSVGSPYLVLIGDKIYMFGGRVAHSPEPRSHWGCIFDCTTRAWTIIEPPHQRVKHGYCTESHFIWGSKVYLLLNPVICDDPKDHEAFICSYDTVTNHFSDERVLFQKLNGGLFYQPKIVVEDILLVFCVKERFIKPFDLKTKRWINQRMIIGMESFSPAPSNVYEDELLPFDSPYHHLYVALSPHAHEHNEVLLLWQVELQTFYTSRIHVQVKKGTEGEILQVSVDLVERCEEVVVDPDFWKHSDDVPGVPGWS